MRYPLIMKNGLCVAEVEGSRYIIDTGAPSCYGKVPEVEFGGKVHKMKSYTRDDTADIISGDLEMKIDGLIGLVAMERHTVTINFSSESIDLDEPFPEHLDSIPLIRKGKCLAISMEILGKPVEAVLDSGAAIAHVDPELLAGLNRTGSNKVYYPTVGYFEADEYRLSCKIGSLQGEMTVLEADESVMRILRGYNLKSCMSLRLFEARPSVTFDLINGLLKF